MYRFFVLPENIDVSSGTIRIEGEDVKHIRSVLRMKPGEEVLLCTGRQDDPRDYLCGILSLAEEEILAEIREIRPSMQELPSKIFLFQGLPKADKFESIIQKSVELGAYEVIPTVMSRSIVRPDAKKAEKKAARWNAISLAAAKQSNRGIIPGVDMPLTFQAALEKAAGLDRIIVPYEDARGTEHTKRVISSLTRGESIGVFIGPEGGFSDAEIENLKNMGAEIVSLGRRILRTETAGPAVLTLLMMQLEQDG